MKMMVVGGGGREHAIIRKLKENPERGRNLRPAGQRRHRARTRVCVNIRRHGYRRHGALCRGKRHRLCRGRAGRPAGHGRGGLVCTRAGMPCFGPEAKAAADRGQQGLFQEPDEEVRHPHRRSTRSLTTREAALAYVTTADPVPRGRQGRRPGAGQGCADLPEPRGRPRTRSGTMMVRPRLSAGSGNQGGRRGVPGGPGGVRAGLHRRQGRECPWSRPWTTSARYDGDKGLNTGGMGTVAPNPVLHDGYS